MGVQVPPSALMLKTPPNPPGGVRYFRTRFYVIMRQPVAPQRQLRTVSQLVVALGVLACLVFAVVYSGRIVAGVQTRQQLTEMQQRVAQQQQFQDQVRNWIARADDPAAVEAFARDEMNWGREGDQSIVTLTSSSPAPAAAPAEPAAVPSASPPNWRLWWNLLAAPGGGASSTDH